MRVEMQVEMRVVKPVKIPQRTLQILQQQPEITISEIAALLGKSASTIELVVSRLKQQNKLVLAGPKKAGRWRVL